MSIRCFLPRDHCVESARVLFPACYRVHRFSSILSVRMRRRETNRKENTSSSSDDPRQPKDQATIERGYVFGIDTSLHILINSVIRVLELFRIVHIRVFYGERLNHIGGHSLLMVYIRYHVLWRGYDLANRRFLHELPLRVDEQLRHRAIVLLLSVICGYRVRGRCAGQLLRLALLRVRVQ